MKIRIFLFCLLFSTLGHADYGIYGHGSETCRDWLQDSKNEPPWGRIIKHAWVLGYVTAFNNMQALEGSPLKATDGAKIATWIDAYCVANPHSTIDDAALALIGTLRN